jgi:hypothetical protein
VPDQGFKKLVGVLLIMLGVVSLAYGGAHVYAAEKVLDIGPIEATAERQRTIPLPPILGAAALAGGIGLLVIGSRKKP